MRILINVKSQKEVMQRYLKIHIATHDYNKKLVDNNIINLQFIMSTHCWKGFCILANVYYNNFRLYNDLLNNLFYKYLASIGYMFDQLDINFFNDYLNDQKYKMHKFSASTSRINEVICLFFKISWSIQCIGFCWERQKFS